jgi:hypothetical protein
VRQPLQDQHILHAFKITLGTLMLGDVHLVTRSLGSMTRAVPVAWRNFGRVRKCWTSARAAGSTCCLGPSSRRDGVRLRRRNDRRATPTLPRDNAPGATNVEFLKGMIDDILLPDGSVDVVISNCVINLSVTTRR